MRARPASGEEAAALSSLPRGGEAAASSSAPRDERLIAGRCGTEEEPLSGGEPFGGERQWLGASELLRTSLVGELERRCATNVKVHVDFVFQLELLNLLVQLETLFKGSKAALIRFRW